MAASSRKFFVPPSMNDDFDAWLREIEIWRCVTDLEKKKQGPAIYLSLDQKTRNACADIDVTELNGDGGVDVLLTKLRTLYARDVNQMAFLAYENFEKFSRPKSMSVGDYINEFERLYFKIKSCKMELPDGVLAYRVLKSSNISQEKEQLARATIAELSYNNMKKQLKSIFDYCSDSSGVKDLKDEIKVEDEVYYNRNSGGGGSRWRNRQRGYRSPNQRGASNYVSRGGRKTNPVDNYGNPSTCAICNSIFHWARDCPDSHEMRRSVEKITLFTQEILDCYISRFLGETLNYGILDSGCTRNVCGRVWLECYLSTLNSQDAIQVQERKSDVHFRFGTGPALKSTKNITFPVYVAEKLIEITCEVVDCDLPLLLSKDWMKSTGTKIDFVKDVANIFGEDVDLQFTESGHYAIPLAQHKTVLLSECLLSGKSTEQKQQLVTKLHKQFGHPSGDKLVKLVQESGVEDKELLNLIRKYENFCEICVRYRKPALRPVVGLSLAKEFNDIVSMDLKYVNGQLFLHLIDHATRYSAGSLIDSKEKGEIIDKIFKHWIAVFGVPNKFLSDNGGEFNNDLFRDMAENLNIKVLTTAAEAPWSNGITERHNAIIANMMTKITQDTQCSATVALAWALSAKNSLQNVYGYSPNQLVFGRNPNTPCVLTDNLPALEGKTTSELIAEHLNALHAARKSFVQSEASEKLRRALRHQIRPSTSLIFEQGDEVFYKRNDGAKWKGPGTVIGKENQQIFVRHGGTYVRVHPCRLRHKNQIDLHEPVKDSSRQSATPLLGPVSEPKCDNTTSELSDSEPDEINEQLGGTENIETDTPLVGGELSASLPTKGNKILFREDSDSEYTEAMVIGRAGKATGKNKQWVNIKDTDGTLKSLNLEVLDWKTVEDVLISHVNAKPRNELISVTEAKLKEIDNWKDHAVYTEVDDQGQKCVSVRWVITEKVKNDQTVVKARLVARGFEEQALDELRKDSPTCCKENLRLVLVIISTFDWKLNSLDVKSAFLQGRDIDRDVFLRPPREAGTNKVWKLNTTVYGLCDAPRVWYLRIKEELIQCGATVSSYDEAVFFWYCENKLQGIICCHVDDFCWGGTKLFHAKVIDIIRSKFQISTEDQEIFRYVGLDLKQRNGEIQMSQQEYIDEIEFLDISLNGRSKSDSITESELKSLRGIAGQLNWTATQTRPDIAYHACETSVSQKNGTIEDLIKVNKSIRKLKTEKVYLTFPCLGDIDKLCLFAFSDASLANLKNGGSQGGYVVFLLGDNGKSALLSWQSKKIRRVVKSTIAAEALALLESAEACCLLRITLCNILNIGVKRVPIHCVVDNKSLCETVYSTKTLIDKRLKIDVCVLRDMLSRGEIQNVDWIDTSNQLADCLTKAGAPSSKLISVLSGQNLLCKYCVK